MILPSFVCDHMPKTRMIRLDSMCRSCYDKFYAEQYEKLHSDILTIIDNNVQDSRDQIEEEEGCDSGHRESAIQGGDIK